MGFYTRAKRIVPLNWKVEAHLTVGRIKNIPTLLSDKRALLKNKLAGGPPLPPGELIFMVAAHRHPSWFLRGGASANQAILRVLENNGIRIENQHPVLDFGCGVGRIIRHFAPLKLDLHGTDYNPDLVDWCRNNLDFAVFGRNGLSAKLDYPDDTFGLIYSFSVFTHLTEPLQVEWLKELTRILRPGGYLYITTHGDSYAPGLTPEQRAQFQKGNLVVVEATRAGENACGAYHPKEYMERLAPPLTIVDFVPEGAEGDSHQDAWLLRKQI